MALYCVNHRPYDGECEMSRKYVYCVMWQGHVKRGMTEILRDTPIKTYIDALHINEYLQEYQNDDGLVITNWIYLGRKCPVVEKDSPHD